MAFEDKTQNNIMIDLKAAIEPDTSTEEGTLIDRYGTQTIVLFYTTARRNYGRYWRKLKLSCLKI